MSTCRPLLVSLVLALTARAAPAADPEVPLSVVQRAVTQGQCPWQFWQVDYLLRNDAPQRLTVPPADLSAEVQGWVSNSRVAAHARPRASNVTVTGASGLAASAEVIASADPDQRCRERVVLQAWPGREAVEPPDPIAKAVSRLVRPEEQPVLEVPPGGFVRVRLRLEHEHQLYGPYDPLLGPRTLALRLGSARLHDTWHLDRERRPPAPDPSWPATPTADRLDARVFVTPPDSLHLEAHVAGNQSYRFPERRVRYATKYRLSYWYLVAPGTEGPCLARTFQHRNTSTWKPLHDGDHQQVLDVVGRWTRVERSFRTEPDATTLQLEFAIDHNADVGELWIDDVRLELVGEAPEGP